MESGLDTTVVWGETTTLPTGRPFRIRAEVVGATELFALYISVAPRADRSEGFCTMFQSVDPGRRERSVRNW